MHKFIFPRRPDGKVSLRVFKCSLNDRINQQQVQGNTHLMRQMKERREPIHILMDDCCPSFFTVPVFRSRIRPLENSRWNFRTLWRVKHYTAQLYMSPLYLQVWKVVTSWCSALLRHIYAAYHK